MKIFKETVTKTVEEIEIEPGTYYGYVDDIDSHRYFRIDVVAGSDIALVLSVVDGPDTAYIKLSKEYELGWYTEKLFTQHPKARFISPEDFDSKHRQVAGRLSFKKSEKETEAFEGMLIDLANEAWRMAANSHRLYPDQIHSFEYVRRYLLGYARKLFNLETQATK